MIKKSLLTRRILYPSAVALRNAIKNITGERLELRYEDSDIPVAIRFGNSSPVYVRDTLLNSRDIIELCSHKGKFSRHLMNDVFTPYYRTDSPPESAYPILVRTTLTGFGGAGIISCLNDQEFEKFLRNKKRDQKFVWTKYWRLSKEYRAHVLGGEIVKLFRKCREDEEEESGIIIRNTASGYTFRRLSEAFSDGKFEQLKLTISNMWEALGMSQGFLGVDIGFCPDKKQYLVIEANTAPGLRHNEDTCEDYAQYLSRLI